MVMAGRITALEPQKRAKDRVSVYLDGEFAFGLAVLVAADLRVGTWLSDGQIAELQAADGIEKAHNRALDYLTYRPRSEAELRAYLTEKGCSEGVVEEVMARLARVGLIDDEGFAQYWRDNRARFRPRGSRMLRYELGQKGVASEVIDSALEEYDEVAAVRRVAQEQARRLGNLPPDVARRRLFERLARRGFSYDLIRETLAIQDFPQLLNNDDNEED
jgi:regulatory protein